MSIDSASSGYSDPYQLVPTFASERADTARSAAAERTAKSGAATEGKELSMFADEEPSFWDLLDVINPLQHIPVINEIYQDLTGDKIGVGARLAGGALFGGPIGLIASAVNCLIEEETGDTIGGHAIAMFNDKEPDTAIAQATPAHDQVDNLPAAPVTAVQLADARAVTMPEAGPAAPPSGGPTMFTSDGAMTQPAPAAASAPPDKLALFNNAPRPLSPIGGPPPRFMPVPARNMSLTPQATPPVSVPISNSGSRSYVPITGQDPVSRNNAASALTAQRMAADQGRGGAEHPMIQAPGNGSVDWLQAMGKALDKYERTGSMATRPQPSTDLNLP